ncbi:hypothetical protein [Bordetella bronchialis]|uniref:hypothetical protein n=1 Tax=Bordetella bronchialis TaxID=463025 RepID=UPI0012E9BAD5|nr:hypothetical protein [Bordetella bronchialis]
MANSPSLFCFAAAVRDEDSGDKDSSGKDSGDTDEVDDDKGSAAKDRDTRASAARPILAPAPAP